jgi:hypothetical protein
MNPKKAGLEAVSMSALAVLLSLIFLLSSIAPAIQTSVSQTAASGSSDPTSTYGVGLTGAPVVMGSTPPGSSGSVAGDIASIEEYFVPNAVKFVFADIGWGNCANTTTSLVACGYNQDFENWLYASNEFGIDTIIFTKQWGYFFSAPSNDVGYMDEYPSIDTVNASGVYVPFPSGGCAGCLTESGWTDASPLVYRAYEADLKQLYTWYGNFTNWIGFGEGATGDRNYYGGNGGTIKTSRPFDNFTMSVYANSVFFQRLINPANGEYVSNGQVSEIWEDFVADQPDIVTSVGIPLPTSTTYNVYSGSNSPPMSFYIPFGKSQTSGFKLLAYLQTSSTPTGTLTATVYPDNCDCGYGKPLLDHPLQSVTVSGVSSSASWVAATFSATLIGGDYYWVRFTSATASGDPYVLTMNQYDTTAVWIESPSGQTVAIYPIYNTGTNLPATPATDVYFEVSQKSTVNTVVFMDSDRAYDPNNITVYLQYPNGTTITTALISQAQTEGIASLAYVPYQFASTVTLYPNIRYQFTFSGLPGSDDYSGSIGGGITQDFITDSVNPSSGGYLGQGYFPVFQVGYMTIDYKDSALVYGTTDLGGSPGYLGDMEDAMRFTPTSNENLQGFTIEVLKADAISGAILNVTLRADNTTDGSHPTSSGSVIASGSLTFSTINSTFKAGPTWSGYYDWANFTFTAKPGHTLALTAGTNYWFVLASGSNYIILQRLNNPYKNPVFVSQNNFKSWGVPPDGPTDLSYMIKTSVQTFNNAILGSEEYEFSNGNSFAQSFETSTSVQLKGVYTNVGAGSDFKLTISIQTDNSNKPSGKILTEQSSVGSPTDGITFFDFPANITASTKYWIVATVACIAPCSNPARAYYTVYASFAHSSSVDYGGGSLGYEILVGSTWTAPALQGNMRFLLVETDFTVRTYDTKELYTEIVADDAQSTSVPPKGWNQFLNYEQAQINYNLTQMISALSGRTFVWFSGIDTNVVQALPNFNMKYFITQAQGAGGGFGCVSQPSCGGVEGYWAGDAGEKVSTILSMPNQTNVIGWSSFGAPGDNVGGVTPEDLRQMYLVELPQIADTSILTANDWSWGSHGLNNFTQTAPMTAFGTILNRMDYMGGYYGSSTSTLKVLWIWIGADGSAPSYLSPVASVTEYNAEAGGNLTQFGNLQQFNVIVNPQQLEGMTASAEARIVAFVKNGGGIVEDSPPAAWEDSIMGLSPSSGCCHAPYTVLSGNYITKPYTSLPTYVPYWDESFTKLSNESAIFDVTDSNGYPVVSSNNYYSGRGVYVDMDAARLSYDSFGDSYTTLLMNAVLYAAHQNGKAPALWTTTYATTQPWSQIVYSIDGSAGHPLLWVSSNSSTSQTFSINLNATYYGITGPWVAINMQSMSVVASGSSSDIAISITIPPFTWAPIYIISRTGNLQPVYSTASITSSSVSSSGGQYATSGSHNASSWLILSTASSPMSVTSSKSSEPLPSFSTLSALNSSKIGEYCTSIASGGGCSSFAYLNQQGWYYDSSNSLLYIHFQQGSPVTIDVSLSQSSSTTSTETTSSSYSTTTLTTTSSPTSNMGSTTTSTTSSTSTSNQTSSMTTSETSTVTSSTVNQTTSETSTVTSSTVNQTTSAPPSGCDQTSSCNQSPIYSTITIQSNAVNPVSVYVDGMAYLTPSSFTWPGGSNHTLTIGELSVSTPTGKSKFLGWSGGINSTSPSLAIRVEGDLSLYATYKNQYLVNITFADAEGRSVSPQNVSIQGPSGAFNLTNPSLWLYSGSYQVTQAEWMGTNVASARDVPVTFAVTASKTIVVPLPIYDETIVVTDIYGLPVSGANVTMTVGNQIQQLLTNSKGQAVFTQVPLGYMNGTVKYLAFSGDIRVSTPGEHTEYVIVTLSYPVLITILSILGVGTFFVVRRVRRRPVRKSDLYSWDRVDLSNI